MFSFFIDFLYLKHFLVQVSRKETEPNKKLKKHFDYMEEDKCSNGIRMESMDYGLIEDNEQFNQPSFSINFCQ